VSDRTREVEAWIAADPDEDDRAELTALLERNDAAELDARFSAPLTFGTAGLRGPERAGPAGMNRLTVRRATQGVVGWLKERGLDPSRGVVVGRDARHGSEKFNDEVVQVLLGAGVTVFEMPRPLPTPLVAYAVRALGAAAGVMITASHNPPQDNGYKLYAEDGAQIIPPDDRIVEGYASHAGAATLASRESDIHFLVAAEVLDEYRRHVLARFMVPGGSPLRLTYTPLHGVGGAVMRDLLADAGYHEVTLTEEQFAPDPNFPTLAFPNPEEPGALDLAIASARSSRSSLVLANDPDADRLGAAVEAKGEWRVLRGDEIGWLLASLLLPDVKDTNGVVATSLVSSSMLEKMAAASGVPCRTTLTGFKWIARAGGSRPLGFGYEEALGYAVDPLVADKDGLSAGLALARLAHDLAEEGRTLLDRLDDLERIFGVHHTRQLSLRATSASAAAKIPEVVARLLSSPPARLGELAASDPVDLMAGWHGLPPTEGVRLGLGSWGRVVVRPSGTEAKLKAYVEITPPQTGELVDQREHARRLGDHVIASLEDLLRLE